MRNKLKKVLLILISVMFLCMTVSVNAKDYTVYGTDISISIGDEWHVMTRDNPTCCDEVEAAGVKAEYMQEFFIMQKMYLDAVITNKDANESIEMFIRKNVTDGGTNLSKASDEEVAKLVTEFEEVYNPKVCKAYKNNYTYVYIENEDGGYNTIEFVTLVNAEIYTITFQKVNEFTEDDMDMLYEIVDSASFTISSEYENTFNWKYIIINVIIGVIAGGAIGGCIGWIIHIKKKTRIS